MKTKIFLLFYGLLCAASLNAQTWNCGDPNVNKGKNVTATLSNDTLTISGKGAMMEGRPWVCIRTVIINDGVTSIGSMAFFGCTRLTSITIPNSVTSIGDMAFYICQNLTSITIPNSVTSIGDKAFFGCRNLTSITIPNSITTIGNKTFKNCRKLSSITILRSIPPVIEKNTFRGVNKQACCLYVPPQAVARYRAAFGWENFRCVYKAGDFVNENEVIDTPTNVAEEVQQPAASVAEENNNYSQVAPDKKQRKGDVAIGVNFLVGIGDELTRYGIGAKLQNNVMELVRMESSFSYFFKKEDISAWELGVDAHYLLPVGEAVTLYQLAGFGIQRTTVHSLDDKKSSSSQNFNIGGGIDCHISDNVIFNVEVKYKTSDVWNLSLG
jgi:hypothetical protein